LNIATIIPELKYGLLDKKITDVKMAAREVVLQFDDGSELTLQADNDNDDINNTWLACSLKQSPIKRRL